MYKKGVNVWNLFVNVWKSYDWKIIKKLIVNRCYNLI